MVKCYVCGGTFSFMGWAKHVQKEKRIHGNDIYVRLKEMRKDKEREFKPIVIREPMNPNGLIRFFKNESG